MQKDSLRSWLTVTALGTATSIAYIDRTLLAVAAPVIMADLRIDAATTGWLLSAFFWSYTIAQIPAGWLVDRYGAKTLLLLGYGAWSIACSLTGSARSLPMLIASRLALGIGEAPVYPAAYHITAANFSEGRRGFASAIYADGAKLGPAIGAPLAGWLIVHFGWRQMFFVVGIASLLWLPLWLIVCPQSSHSEASPSLRPAISWRRLLTSRAVCGMIIGWFSYLYVFYMYATWLPSYLVLDRGFTVLKAGWYASLPFVIQFVFSLIGGYFADYLIRRQFSATLVRKASIGVGLLLGLFLIPAATTTSSTAALMFLLTALAGMGVASANMFAIPPALAPSGYAGRLGSLQNSAGALGGVMAPIATGALYSISGSFIVPLITAATMLLLSAIAYLLVLPTLAPPSNDAHHVFSRDLPATHLRSAGTPPTAE